MITIFVIVALIVAAEFGLHILYEWKVGGAGLEDEAFAYLHDLPTLGKTVQGEWAFPAKVYRNGKYDKYTR